MQRLEALCLLDQTTRVCLTAEGSLMMVCSRAWFHPCVVESSVVLIISKWSRGRTIGVRLGSHQGRVVGPFMVCVRR